MATFVMLGRYSHYGIEQMSPARTGKSLDLIKQLGGSVQSMHATLGPQDLVFIVDFPDVESAMKAAVGLNKMTGIGFTTCPAVTVERFDKLVG